MDPTKFDPFGNPIVKNETIQRPKTPSPGPGHYKPKKQHKLVPPSYSMKGRRGRLTKKVNFPGPGAYSIDENFKIGQNSIKKLKGTFSVAERFRSVGARVRKRPRREESEKGRTSRTFFGVRKRGKKGKDKKFGSYMSMEMKSIKEKVGISRNGLGELESKIATPGPGAYDLTNAGVGSGFTKPKVPSFLRKIKNKNLRKIRETEGKAIF